jgi:hypothetical protein
MSNGYVVDAKKVASGGYFHLLRAPFGTAAAKEHRSNAPFLSGVTAGAEQAPYLSLLGAQRFLLVAPKDFYLVDQNTISLTLLSHLL